LLFGLICAAIAVAETKDEILDDWIWIEKNLMPSLGNNTQNTLFYVCQHKNIEMFSNLESFEVEDDISNFVFCKIQSLIVEGSNVKENEENKGKRLLFLPSLVS
jgi:hypothetical protein